MAHKIGRNRSLFRGHFLAKPPAVSPWFLPQIFPRCPTEFIISTHPIGKFSCSHGGLDQSCSARQKRAESVFLLPLIAGVKTCSLRGSERLLAVMGYALDSDLYPKVRATLSGVAPRFPLLVSSSCSQFDYKMIEATPKG